MATVYSAVIVSDAPKDEAPALSAEERDIITEITHTVMVRYLDDYRQKLPAPIDALRPLFSDDNLPWKLGDEEKVKMNVDSIVRRMIFRLEDLLREIPILVGRKQRMFLDDPEPEILKAAMERVFGLQTTVERVEGGRMRDVSFGDFVSPEAARRARGRLVVGHLQNRINLTGHRQEEELRGIARSQERLAQLGEEREIYERWLKDATSSTVTADP